MDKEKVSKNILNIIALGILIFSLLIGFYYVFNPHYFYVSHDPYSMELTQIRINDVDLIEPSLDCSGQTRHGDDKLISIQIYWKTCYMDNLPLSEPYIKQKNIYLYYIIANQWIILLLYLFIFLLDECHKYYYKKESYIRAIIRKYKH